MSLGASQRYGVCFPVFFPNSTGTPPNDQFKGTTDISLDSRVDRFITGCRTFRDIIPAEVSESAGSQSDLQLERDQALSPVKRPSCNRTRDLDYQSNFTKEEFDYPFNGKVIMQDMKLFFRWVFTGFKTSASEDLKIKKSVEAIIFSWDSINEGDSVPHLTQAEEVVKAARSFIEIVTANATSAFKHRFVLYSGATVAFVARSTNLEYLQLMAGAVSLIAFCSMGWRYASRSLDESEAKDNLKNEVDTYINEIEPIQRAVSCESGTSGLEDTFF